MSSATDFHPGQSTTGRGPELQGSSKTEKELWHDEPTETSLLTKEDDPDDYPDGGWKAYSVVLGAFLGLTVDFGALNSIGAIQSYLNLHQFADVSTKTSSLIFAVFTLITYVTGILSGAIFDVFGPTIPIVIGSLFVFLGFFITGNCNTTASFVGVFGVVAGTGMGILAAPLTGSVSHWFYRKRSFAFGIATLGGSIGGIFFPLVLNRLYKTVGFTWALRVFAFICLGLLGLATFLVRDRPDIQQAESKKSRSKQLLVAIRTSVDLRALKEPAFLFCALGMGLSDLSLLCTQTYFPSYITEIGFSETQANLSVTIMNCMGIIGRFIPGIIADKYGCFNVMISMMTLSVLTLLLLWRVWSLNSQSLTSVYVFSVFYGLFNSSVLSLCPSCVGQISRTTDFGKRYATNYLLAGFFVFGGVVGGGAILGDNSLDNFGNFALYCGLTNLLGTGFFCASRYFQVGTKLRAKV